MAWRYVLYSISFSVPRCRSPICGSTRSTTSPSSSSTSRSTPCAAGCCGPKLIVKLRSGAVSAMSHRNLHGFVRLLGESRSELVPGDDEALVPSFADEIDAVMRTHAKRRAAAVHLGAFGIDRHLQPRRRRGRMADIDVDPEA